MKNFIAIIAALLLSINSFADNTVAVNSAMSWLDVIDSGEYQESWNQSAPFFKNQLSADQWVVALNQVRTPLGKVSSRTVYSTESSASLPKAPDGEYVVITLLTDFEKKPASIETITLSKTNFGWQAVGYFIK